MNLEAMKIVRDNLKMGSVLSFAEVMIIHQAIDAAMLNAEPVSQPYKLPQWIPCSERMPEENNRDIWLFDGKYVRYGYIYDGHKFIDWDEGYVELTEVTHWMPMTVPNAPQEPAK